MLSQLLQVILMALVVLQFNQKLGAFTVIDHHQQYHPVETGVQVAPANTPTVSEAIFIRHSRSRANRYLHNENAKVLRGLQNVNETSIYELSSNIHNPLKNIQNESQSSTPATESMSTATANAVTHKIRMLHKKQVMESKRKSMDGMKLFRHRSLIEAEQLQGRLMEEEPNSHTFPNYKNNFDDVSVQNNNKDMEGFYQNDEYLGVTLPNILLPLSYDTTSDKKVEMSLDYHISNSKDSSARLMTTTTKRAITKLHPVESMLSKIHLPNKLNQNSKEANTEAGIPPQQREYEEDDEQQSISTLEPRSSPTEQLLQYSKFLKEQNDSSSSSSSSNGIVLSEENVNRSAKLINSNMKRGDFLLFDNTMNENNSYEPSIFASTSLIEQRQQLSLSSQTDKLEEASVDDALIDNRHASGFPLESEDSLLTTVGGDDGELFESNQLLEGVIDAANEDEIYDWDEISRNNRRNLMRGRDVVTKFLQIVETQHSLGSKCEAGTSLNLGEGVVDRYAQDRFRVEAEVAVNRANMLTR